MWHFSSQMHLKLNNLCCDSERWVYITCCETKICFQGKTNNLMTVHVMQKLWPASLVSFFTVIEWIVWVLFNLKLQQCCDWWRFSLGISEPCHIKHSIIMNLGNYFHVTLKMHFDCIASSQQQSYCITHSIQNNHEAYLLLWLMVVCSCKQQNLNDLSLFQFTTQCNMLNIFP